MFLDHAYTQEEVNGETRTVLKLDKRLAPVKVAVFPAVAQQAGARAKARAVYDILKGVFMCEFDDNGNIGKRYRRQDEIGTPWCLTIDFQTLEDGTITVRDRDTLAQERVAIASCRILTRKMNPLEVLA